MDAESSSSERITLPNFIYVSELLRTWETAVLLFLSLLNTNLTLYISPYLRETGIFPSDEPGYLKEQVKEFIRFIAFLRELKKLNIDGISNLIPESFTIILKHFGGNFDEVFTQDIEKPEGVELSIEGGGIQISCNFNKDNGLPSRIDPLEQNNIAKMLKAIQVDKTSGYVPYANVSSKSESALQIPTASGVLIKETDYYMKTPSEPAGSLPNFVDWYSSLQPKPYSASNIVTAVSHSGTMKNFVTSVKKINSPPSPEFNQEYDIALNNNNGTNTCSLVFKSSDGTTFSILRHAASCDNRNMGKGGFKGTKARLGDSGIYASLSLWGILSTLKFSNKKLQILITTQQIENPPGLKICRGMVKETPEYLTDSYDSMNMLCGEQRDRLPIRNFSLSLGHCGTSGGIMPTLDSNCIRIITDSNGRKVVLYLDKEKNVIQARFFESAVTSKNYENIVLLEKGTLSTTLVKIIKWLSIDVTSNNTLKLQDELMKSIKLFIDKDEEFNNKKNKSLKLLWGKVFDSLYTNYDSTLYKQQREQQQQEQQQLREEQRQKFIAGLNADHTAVKDLNILDDTKCIKITANTGDTFTLDLVDCARPTSESGAELNFALLFLDKDKHKIECKLFEKNKSTGINFSFDNGEYLSTYLVNILTGLGVIHLDSDKDKQKSLKLNLIESIKTFIENNTDIDSEWQDILGELYTKYIDIKKLSKESKSASASSDDLGLGEPVGVGVTAGGTNKRTRRHRRRHGNYKVMKKYTRKNKKYNPRRKSRRIQKRKQTHKRKSRKSRKPRKSRK